MATNANPNPSDAAARNAAEIERLRNLSGDEMDAFLTGIADEAAANAADYAQAAADRREMRNRRN